MIPKAFTCRFGTAVLGVCRTLLLYAMAAASAVAGPGAHGPGGEHLDAPPQASASGLARLPDGSVNVPKLAQRRMEIRTAPAPQTEAALTVELPGRVLINPNAGGRVQTAHGGRVEPGPRGLPVAGQSVRRGDVLAYVRHHADPYATAAQAAQLAELRTGRAVAEARVQRLEALEGTVPQKEIVAARNELAGYIEREKQIAASLVAREILVAPVSGVIAKADVLAGQIVESRDVLFDVIDPAQMIVEATTADPLLGGRILGATLLGLDGVVLKFAGGARSFRDGVLPLTFRVQLGRLDRPPSLAVGQPVTVVATTNERIKGIVLPAQAIVRSPANEPVVWIKVSAERYLPQPVKIRWLGASTVIVTHGLAPDNRVVVSGAPLIAQIR